MPEPFRILAQVNPDQLGFATDPVGSFVGPIRARHKWNSEYRPYCLANEVICAELGRFIGLPIPPYAVTNPEDVEQKFWFSSLEFTFGSRQDRPVLGDRIVACLPELAAGILVFDVFIANADRHDENLKVDLMMEPTQVRVYDHDQALFGGASTTTQGIQRLTEMQGRLGISGGTTTGGRRHALLDHFKSNELFGHWCHIISEMPRSFLERTCRQCRLYGLTADEEERAAVFLNDRKWDLRSILTQHRKEFTGITNWLTL
jgi:hypothetical protein